MTEDSIRICFLSSAHSPTDKRVFLKEARTLAAAGYDVVHLAPGDEESRVEDGVKLEVYQAGRTIAARFFSMFSLYRRAKRIEADVYNCNEVDSWLVGIALKLFRGRVVVFDVHEHYPSTFARQHGPWFLMGVTDGCIRLAFRLLTPLTDYFVFAKQTVTPDFPNSQDRAITVLNCATLEGSREDDPAPAREASKDVIAVHVGVFHRERGWPQLIEALRLSKSPNLRIRIIGTCTDRSKDEFQRAVKSPDIADRIEVIEWLPVDEMIRELERSDIGLVLFQPGIQNHIFAMPHKMFDYMKARLPVIVPEFAVEVAPIVREAECGILIDPSDPQQIADAMDRLVADADLRRTLGERGRSAVYRRYNWEEEAKLLLALYERIAEECAVRGRRSRAAV